MMTVETDFSRFNQGMANFVSQLGIEAQTVVKKEVGELMKTLVKYTPAAESDRIRENITRKFNTVASERNSDFSRAGGGGKAGIGGILWFSVNSDYLIGVAPQNDLRDASVDELKKLSYTITKSGRLKTPIKNHRHQQALIYQTILTKASTVKKLIAAKVKNRGRLKAGWLASFFSGTIPITGANQPPIWVTRHRSGVGGYYIDNLGTKDFPSFTIANTAKGVGNRKLQMNAVVQSAVNSRAGAMAKNLALYLRGKKYLGDYAR